MERVDAPHLPQHDGSLSLGALDMPTLWIPGEIWRGLDDPGDRIEPADLFSALEALDGSKGAPKSGRLETATGGGCTLNFTPILDGVLAVVTATCGGQDVHAPSGWRAVVIPADVLDALLGDERKAVLDRLIDVSNIEEARRRNGLKYIAHEKVASIFVAGSHRRIHFALDEGFATILGIFDANLWTTHSSSHKVKQPAATDLAAWRRLHEAATAARDKLTKSLVRAPVMPATPLTDGWIAVNQIRDLGITSEAITRQILACSTENDVCNLIGTITDEQFERLEAAFNRFRAAETRHAENTFDPIEVLALQSSIDAPSGKTFDEWLEQLTPSQRRIVEMDRKVPVRLKGGPGTGKSLTAMLRAGYLVRRAKERGEPARIGFFVFSRDLGRQVYEQLRALGFEEHFDPASSQRLVVTSLQEWCERFIDVDRLGVEPIAPYRAGHTEKNRRALLEIALEEARRRLTGSEYDALWAEFDARSKNGVAEIETEISQFIKARDLTDFTSYLNEKRPSRGWLAGSEKAFRRFVWEIFKVYEDALHGLGLIDSDDLVNDAIKEVTKSIWKSFRLPAVGFDYLILDEAQDFFRNQLTLVRHLAKRSEGILICYDEAQAVYSRYPSLRDLGFDTDGSFEGKRLEENFRSTKQILAAIRTVAAQYPTFQAVEHWGDFTGGGALREGARPIAVGFQAESRMFDQMAQVVEKALRDGVSAKEIAVIAFHEELLARLRDHLEKRQVRTHVLSGTGKRPPRNAVTLGSAKLVKGLQFDTCVLVGVDRDRLPDFEGVLSDSRRELKREDDLRLFLVAASRCKRELHLLWHGAEPSEFVSAMGTAMDRLG